MDITFYKHPQFKLPDERLQNPSFIEEIYETGRNLDKGRGSSKIIAISSKEYLLKKEVRGGLFSNILSSSFLDLSKFNNELEIVQLLSDLNLTFPILLRVAYKKHLLWNLFTLLPYYSETLSLKEMSIGLDWEDEKIFDAGKTIAKLHKLGFYHSDLNMGNIVFQGNDCKIIDFKNSYFYSSPLGKSLSLKNILRLIRSYHKENLLLSIEPKDDFEEILLSGYLSERDELNDFVSKKAKSPLQYLRKSIYRIRYRKR